MLILVESSKTRRTVNSRKHQAILRAAAKLFLKQGYSDTSMEEIAALSGVTKQTIYAHFGSKDELFRVIIEDQCQRHTPIEDGIEHSGLPLEEMLFQLGIKYLQMLLNPECLAMYRVILIEAERKPHLAKLFYETGPQRMIDLLARCLEAPHIRVQMPIVDTVEAASYFCAMLKESYHLRILLKVKPQPAQKELENHVRATVSMFRCLYQQQALLPQQAMN